VFRAGPTDTCRIVLTNIENILTCSNFHFVSIDKRKEEKQISVEALVAFDCYYKESGTRSRYSDWLWARRPRGRSSNCRSVQDFSLLHVVQTGSGAHLASYPMSTWGSFPGGKAA
jgi:hypothetical protein